jgi:ribosomal protein S18 acetylase RimI-like enzyme
MGDLLRRLTITELRDDDVAFLHDTWARSYRLADECRGMPTSAFHPWHRRVREQILARSSTLVLVARDRERPIWIAGYGVFERVGDAFVVHWLGVKGPCKKQGVAGRLLAEATRIIGPGARRMVATHRTYVAGKAEELGFQCDAQRSVLERLEELYAERARDEAVVREAG